jgi:hypothetical protein
MLNKRTKRQQCLEKQKIKHNKKLAYYKNSNEYILMQGVKLKKGKEPLIIVLYER